jgi:hypothetical protein
MFKVIGVFDIGMLAWAVTYTVRFYALKRKWDSITDDEKCLTRKERKARALRRLQLKDDQENQRLIEATLEHLKEGKTFL